MTLDLLDLLYPTTPAARDTDTSQEAAAAIKPAASYLREKVIGMLHSRGPMSADSLAGALGVDRLSIRPRTSELRKMGLIEDTGIRAFNDSGKRAIVWGVIK